jgi:hypothetical protein
MESDIATSAADANSSERRREPRFAVSSSLALTIHGHPSSAAEVINISWSGVGIVADRLLGEPGDRLVAELASPLASKRVALPCHVRWAVAENDPLPNQRLRWLHGAGFIELDALARRLIQDLIREAELGRGGLPPGCAVALPTRDAPPEVGAGEQRRRDRRAEGPGRLRIEDAEGCRSIGRSPGSEAGVLRPHRDAAYAGRGPAGMLLPPAEPAPSVTRERPTFTS